MVKVSIITRTKDRPVFLARAIESVHSQSYKDFVHVVVNDGGDASVIETVVSSFPKNVTDKIKIFHRIESSGAPDTIFNESIDRVDSDFFAIHDDDDTWHGDFLETTVNKLEESPALGAVVVRADKVTEVLKGDRVIQRKTSHWMPDIKVISLYKQCIDNQLTPIATLYRRSAYEDVGKFDDSLPVVGDWEFGIRLLSSYDVDYIDSDVALARYHHRVYRKGSAVNTSFAGNDKHRYYTNKIINKYLREDIRSNSLGLGYIMASLKYSQSLRSEIAKKLLPRFMTKVIKNKLDN